MTLTGSQVVRWTLGLCLVLYQRAFADINPSSLLALRVAGPGAATGLIVAERRQSGWCCHAPMGSAMQAGIVGAPRRPSHFGDAGASSFSFDGISLSISLRTAWACATTALRSRPAGAMSIPTAPMSLPDASWIACVIS